MLCIERRKGIMKMLTMLQWKKILREVAWITIAAMAIAIGVYMLRPDAMPGSFDGAIDDGGPTAKIISIETAIDHFKKGTALFADARPLDAFNAGHIKGALHLDPSEFDQWSERLFSQASSDVTIIAYCEGAQCQLSRELADKLTWLGYEKVYCLKDGWGLWKKQGLPVGKPGDSTDL
jgi:rhodanese-related sulfurtransferase